MFVLNNNVVQIYNSFKNKNKNNNFFFFKFIVRVLIGELTLNNGLYSEFVGVPLCQLNTVVPLPVLRSCSGCLDHLVRETVWVISDNQPRPPRAQPPLSLHSPPAR